MVVDAGCSRRRATDIVCVCFLWVCGVCVCFGVCARASRWVCVRGQKTRNERGKNKIKKAKKTKKRKKWCVPRASECSGEDPVLMRTLIALVATASARTGSGVCAAVGGVDGEPTCAHAPRDEHTGTPIGGGEALSARGMYLFAHKRTRAGHSYTRTVKHSATAHPPGDSARNSECV